MNEKKRGRPPKEPAEQVQESADQESQATDDVEQPIEVPVNQELTAEQVQAWIRANRDKMPPLPDKVIKRKRKMTRM